MNDHTFYVDLHFLLFTCKLFDKVLKAEYEQKTIVLIMYYVLLVL